LTPPARLQGVTAEPRGLGAATIAQLALPRPVDDYRGHGQVAQDSVAQALRKHSPLLCPTSVSGLCGRYGLLVDRATLFTAAWEIRCTNSGNEGQRQLCGRCSIGKWSTEAPFVLVVSRAIISRLVYSIRPFVTPAFFPLFSLAHLLCRKFSCVLPPFFYLLS
jgi:hypothetical protein